MDTSARGAMKDAAKCEKHCEFQISERTMRERGYPTEVPGTIKEAGESYNPYIGVLGETKPLVQDRRL